MVDYQLAYEAKKRILEDLIIVSKERLERAINRYNNSVAAFEKDDGKDEIQKMKHSRILEGRMNNVRRAEHAVEFWEDKLYYLRVGSIEDEEYRNRQLHEFAAQVKKYVPGELHLCFHGCPIGAARHILEDGAILSSVDRIGVSTSYDFEDQVSVSTKDNIDVTVQGYADLKEVEYPAGCIFAILPKDEIEISTSRNSSLIRNVFFKEHPERLYAIITTPENIERVTEWAKKSGVDSSKICDFDGFIQLFEKSKGTELIEEMES